MCAFLCLLKVKLSTTDGYIMTMLNEVLNALTEAQQTWTTSNQRDAVYRERTLQSCHFEELIQNNVCIRITLHVNNDTHTLTARFVIYVRDTFKLTFLHEVSNIFNKLLLINSVRNLCHNNLIVALIALNLSLSTHYDTATTSLIGILNTLKTINICTCWEVWSRNKLHQTISRYLWIINISTTSIDNLTKVMRRDICCHTHSNTITTIYKQVRNLCRHHSWFAQRIVKVVDHVNRILLDIVHNVLTHL